MKTFGFANSIKILSAVVSASCLVTFAFGGPVPGAPMRTLQKKLPCWIDRDAIKNVTFCLLGAAVALSFFGYMPLLFSVTEWAEREPLNATFFLSAMNG